MADDVMDCCEKWVIPNRNDGPSWMFCKLLLLPVHCLFGALCLHCYVFAAALVTQLVDQVSGGNPVLQLSDFGATASDRLQNRSAMPAECAAEIPVDAVSNISVAENCTKWCHESLGPNSATPYMASPLHMHMILDSNTSSVYMTCFKTQTSWWALQVMPSGYYVYPVAMLYGAWSIVAFCYTGWKTARHTVPGGPAEDRVWKDGPFATGMGSMPLCCVPVSTDREGSEMDLSFGALSLWLEPFLDIASILTLLRLGQPFPACFMALGVALSCLVARDPLQLGGAKAMALSLRQGFATRGLVEHRCNERWEAIICTTVQCYTLMTLHVEAMDLFAVLNLAFSTGLSIFLSIPSGLQAMYMRDWSPCLHRGQDWSYQNLYKAKQSMPLEWRLFALVSCPIFGMMAKSCWL